MVDVRQDYVPSTWHTLADSFRRQERRRIAAAVPSFHILFELLHSDDFIAFVPERLLLDRRTAVRIFETALTSHPLKSWPPGILG